MEPTSEKEPMKRILVIDDDEAVREIIVDILEHQGYDVETADDGWDGVVHARTSLPELILCDIDMPGLNGYEVLDKLRHDPLTATIPFIFLTGYAVDISDFRRGMDEGADDYLTKPFKPVELVNAIETRCTKQVAVRKMLQEKLDDLRKDIDVAIPHELRTSLSGLIGASATIKKYRERLSLEEIYEMIDIIYSSAERLNRIVHNNLLFSELHRCMDDEESTMAMREQRLLLNDNRAISSNTVITTTAAEIARQAGREQDLLLETGEAAIMVPGMDLEKIVLELLDNAFKYSKSGSEVKVSSRLAEAWLPDRSGTKR